MSDPKKPSDRLPKRATKFTFEVDAKTYSLPLASVAAENVTGRQTRDALVDGELGQIRLGFLMLENCGADPKSIDALYDQSKDFTVQTLHDWMTFGDGDGASLPQS